MSAYFFTNLCRALFGTILAFAVLMLLLLAENSGLQMVVSAVDGTVKDWIGDFDNVQDTAIAGAAALALLWHMVALFSVARASDHRIWWIVLWCLSLLGAVGLCFFLMPPVAAGTVWVYLFGTLNAPAVYWLATAGFTPASCKYAPLGSGPLTRAVLR